MKEEKINKILRVSLFIFGAVIIALIAEGLYLVKFKNKKVTDFFPLMKDKTDLTSSESAAPSTGEEETKLPNLEIAEKVRDWLNMQRDKQGVYFHNQKCQSGKDCETLPSNISGMAVIWGYFKHFQTTGSEKSLKFIRRDLNTYTDREKVEVIQNDFWNCKLMYEMAQSDLFSESERKQIRSICFNSGYADLEKLSEKQDSVSYIKYPSFSSDFSAKYLWRKEESDLDKAEFYLERADDLYNERLKDGGKAVTKLDKCLLGVAFLDFYRISQESEELNRAIEIWNKNKSEQPVGLLGKAVCTLFDKQLFRVTNDDKYLAAEENLVNSIITESFNYDGYPAHFDGDGSFITIEPKGKKEANKSIRENGLVLGILSE